MTIHQEIKDLCNSIIEAPVYMGRFITSIAEEIQVECEEGLRQPHLTTHDGRMKVWGISTRLTNLMEAATFKDENCQAYMSLLSVAMSDWAEVLSRMYYEDGTQKPPQAVFPNSGNAIAKWA